MDGRSTADEGFSGLIDLVEEGDEALSFGLGDGFANGFADESALAHELLIEGIDHLEDVFGPAEDGEEGGRLLEEIGEALALALQLLDRERALCSMMKALVVSVQTTRVPQMVPSESRTGL